MTFKPQTDSEKLLYSTLRIETNNGDSGTGFFFSFNIDKKKVPVIITNKHVVHNNPNEEVKFFLHIFSEVGIPDEEKLAFKIKTKWYFHKDKDLCFCFVAPLFMHIRQKKKKEIFYTPLTENLIWNNLKLEELNVIEDVIMVGYPTGLWDMKNNLPLFRKGITSSHPAIDFNEENIGVVDMACFPGSSGSPIFIFNEGSYATKKGYNFGSGRIIFLGVLFAGPKLNSKGDLIIEDIPTQQKVSSLTPLMINLGYYIKASEILLFKETIKNVLEQKERKNE